MECREGENEAKLSIMFVISMDEVWWSTWLLKDTVFGYWFERLLSFHIFPLTPFNHSCEVFSFFFHRQVSSTTCYTNPASFFLRQQGRYQWGSSWWMKLVVGILDDIAFNGIRIGMSHLLFALIFNWLTFSRIDLWVYRMIMETPRTILGFLLTNNYLPKYWKLCCHYDVCNGKGAYLCCEGYWSEVNLNWWIWLGNSMIHNTYGRSGWSKTQHMAGEDNRHHNKW